MSKLVRVVLVLSVFFIFQGCDYYKQFNLPNDPKDLETDKKKTRQDEVDKLLEENKKLFDPANKRFYMRTGSDGYSCAMDRKTKKCWKILTPDIAGTPNGKLPLYDLMPNEPLHSAMLAFEFEDKNPGLSFDKSKIYLHEFDDEEYGLDQTKYTFTTNNYAKGYKEGKKIGCFDNNILNNDLFFLRDKSLNYIKDEEKIGSYSNLNPKSNPNDQFFSTYRLYMGAVSVIKKINTTISNYSYNSCKVPQVKNSKYNFWWEKERNRYTSDPIDFKKFNTVDLNGYITYTFDTKKEFANYSNNEQPTSNKWNLVSKTNFDRSGGDSKFNYNAKGQGYSKAFELPIRNINYNKLFKQGIWNDIPRLVETKKDYAYKCYGYPFLDKEWHISLNIDIDLKSNRGVFDDSGIRGDYFIHENYIKWSFVYNERLKNIKNNFEKMTINHCSVNAILNKINENGLADFNNWRIPDFKELKEIMSNSSPMLNEKYFPEVTQYKEDFENHPVNTNSFFENNFDSFGYKIYQNEEGEVFLPIFKKGIIIMVVDINEKE